MKEHVLKGKEIFWCFNVTNEKVIYKNPCKIAILYCLIIIRSSCIYRMKTLLSDLIQSINSILAFTHDSVYVYTDLAVPQMFTL